MPADSSAKEFEALKSDISKMREDIDALLSAIVAEQAENLEDLKDEATSQADRVKRAGRAAFDRAKAQGNASLESLEETVQARPITSLLVAFGAGLVIAQLLRR